MKDTQKFNCCIADNDTMTVDIYRPYGNGMKPDLMISSTGVIPALGEVFTASIFLTQDDALRLAQYITEKFPAENG